MKVCLASLLNATPKKEVCVKKLAIFGFVVVLAVVSALLAQSVKETRMCNLAIDKTTDFEFYSGRVDVSKADRERAIAVFVGARETTDALGCGYVTYRWRK